MEDDAGAAAGIRSPRIEAYLALAEQHPAWFEGPSDGMIIALSPERIAAIEEILGARYAARGLPAEWAQVGIRYEDPYLVLLVDAVVFPTGEVGVHHRVVRRTPGLAGVAVLPLLEGRIVLIRHFRHALRQWSWEIPRGGVEAGATGDETARTELMEEIGASIRQLVPLGVTYGAGSFMGMSVALYVAEISSIGDLARDEGIGAVRTLTVGEFEDMVRDGDVVDGFTLAAFLHARLRRLV